MIRITEAGGGGTPANRSAMHVAEISFARFVYPFVFEENQSLEAIVAHLKEAGWTPGKFPESDLLPHVRDYLNASEGREATAYLLVRDSLPLAQPDQRTLATAGEATKRWQIQLPDRELPFVLEGAQLAIFRGGVALLTLDARPESDVLADWLDFVHSQRVAGGRAPSESSRAVVAEHALRTYSEG